MAQRISYEEFKKNVGEKFLKYMSEVDSQYAEYILKMEEIKKINRCLDGFTILKEGEGCMSPTLYVQDVYEDFLKAEVRYHSVEEALDEVLRVYAKHMHKHIQKVRQQDVGLILNCLKDAELFKKNLFLQVIGAEANAELLANMPHRIIYDDLAVIYRVSVDLKGADGSFVITNNHLSHIKMTEDEMFEVALNNTLEINPVRIISMCEMFVSMGMPEEVAKEACSGPGPKMYVVKSLKNCYGAYSILKPDLFQSVSEAEAGDLFIIPSSIHELIAVRYDADRIDYVKSMVEEVNFENVSPEERLSNSVYRYNVGENAIERIV